jgi:hypothetical protein
MRKGRDTAVGSRGAAVGAFSSYDARRPIPDCRSEAELH